MRFVLAVAKTGSLSAAARALGVNHATVLRRVAAFEARGDVAMFDRTARGYRLAPRRRQILAALEAMEAAALAVDRTLSAARAPLAGVVRVSATDSLCLSILPAITARLMAGAEGLSIELNAQNQHADLARLDADVAVRAADHLPQGLTGERAGRLAFAVYSAPGAGQGWLGLSGPLMRSGPARWMAETVPEQEITARADSFALLREMVAAGQGRAVLPRVLGDGDGRLLRLDGAMPEMAVDLWVASHPDLAEVPRIRAVRAMLRRELERDAGGPGPTVNG